jgi:hypothetical protein
MFSGDIGSNGDVVVTTAPGVWVGYIEYTQGANGSVYLVLTSHLATQINVVFNQSAFTLNGGIVINSMALFLKAQWFGNHNDRRLPSAQI